MLSFSNTLPAPQLTVPEPLQLPGPALRRKAELPSALPVGPVILKAMFDDRLIVAAMVPPLHAKVPAPANTFVPVQVPTASSTVAPAWIVLVPLDRKSTRLNSSHLGIS